MGLINIFCQNCFSVYNCFWLNSSFSWSRWFSYKVWRFFFLWNKWIYEISKFRCRDAMHQFNKFPCETMNQLSFRFSIQSQSRVQSENSDVFYWWREKNIVIPLYKSWERKPYEMEATEDINAFVGHSQPSKSLHHMNNLQKRCPLRNVLVCLYWYSQEMASIHVFISFTEIVCEWFPNCLGLFHHYTVQMPYGCLKTAG